MAGARFYYDLGSPYAYLTAERIEAVIGEPVLWRPISLGAVFKATGRSSWSLGDERRRREGMAEVERRALAYGLPAVVWPQPWPSNYLYAMRAATFAAQAGRGREFALEAFRAAFARGEQLGEPEAVLDAAERAGLARAEVRAAVGEERVKLALRQATEEAHALGVIGVPTVAVDGHLFWGDDRLAEAAAVLDV